MSMTFARLELTDGITSIDLLRGGVYAKDYRPGITQLKDGGIWQDNALATGRRLVDRRFMNVADTLDMAISGPNQDDTIARCGDLLRLLEKARDFTASSWQSAPVWLKRQAGCESNPTYALVYDYSLPELSNPFAAPFAAATELATLDGFDLGLEHSIWLSEPPGDGACVQAGTDRTVEFGADWTVTAAAPTNQVRSLLQSTTGRIFAGYNGGIDQSDDDGDVWALCTAAPVGYVNAMIQLASGRILAGETGGVWRSDNDGGAWAFSVEAFGEVFSFVQLTSGRILAGDDGQIWASDDNGATWALVTTNPTNDILCMIQTTGGRVLAGERGTGITWASDDNGATWYVIFYGFSASADIFAMLQTTTGRILKSDYTSDHALIKSDDDGLSWAIITITLGYIYALTQLASGRILAGGDTDIWKSDDDGNTWGLSSAAPTGSVLSFVQSTTGRALAGEANAHVWKSGPVTSMAIGETANCLDEQFIANKANTANITHVFVASGGGLVFGANLLPMVFPVMLLPPAPAVNDAVYFGNNSSDPFESLVFDLSAAVTFTVDYEGRWEYYTGAAWVSVSTSDETDGGNNRAFVYDGVRGVYWAPPSNWAAVAVNGVTGLWVRWRITDLGGGSATPPIQQNRNVYSITWPEIDIASTQVSGDIPAIARVILHNRSAINSTYSASDLHDNRIIVGLRSYDRGAVFTAFLNAADEQNIDGISVTLGAGTAYSNSVLAPTGRLCTYSAVLADTTFTTRITFNLQPVIARDFYGTFHAFLRGTQGSGNPSDIHARLQVTTGSGGVTLTSAEDYYKGLGFYEILDFGRVTIPASGIFDHSDLGDTTTLAVQFRNDSGGAISVYTYDLILIPVDECAIDAVDYANSAFSTIGKLLRVQHSLDIDSLTYQKVDVRTLVRTANADGYITATYVPSGGPVVLQANARQRLWTLAMHTSATGTAYQWLAPPWIAHSVQIWANERWLAMRGNR